MFMLKGLGSSVSAYLYNSASETKAVDTSTFPKKHAEISEAEAFLHFLNGGVPGDAEERKLYNGYCEIIYDFLKLRRENDDELTFYLSEKRQLTLSFCNGSTTMEMDGEELTLTNTTFDDLMEKYNPQKSVEAKHDDVIALNDDDFEDFFKSEIRMPDVRADLQTKTLKGVEILEDYKASNNSVVMESKNNSQFTRNGNIVAMSDNVLEESLRSDLRGIPEDIIEIPDVPSGVDLKEPPGEVSEDIIEIQNVPLELSELDFKIYVQLYRPSLSFSERQLEQTKLSEITYAHQPDKKIVISKSIVGDEINQFIKDNIDSEGLVLAPYVEKRSYKGFKLTDRTTLLAIVNHKVYLIDSKDGLSKLENVEDGLKEKVSVLGLNQQKWEDPYDERNYVYENFSRVLDHYISNGKFDDKNPFQFLQIKK